MRKKVECLRGGGSFSQQILIYCIACRFAKYHMKDGYDSRDLIKAYGILFKVEVIGTVSLSSQVCWVADSLVCVITSTGKKV